MFLVSQIVRLKKTLTQLCLLGDFGQESPICADNKPVRFAFQSKIWNQITAKTFVLKKSYRCQDMLVRIVNDVRNGKLSPITKHTLLGRHKKKKHIPKTATMLFSTNAQVNKENHRRNKKLSGRSVYYKALDSGKQIHWMALERLGA